MQLFYRSGPLKIKWGSAWGPWVKMSLTPCSNDSVGYGNTFYLLHISTENTLVYADSKQMLRQKRQTLIPERFLTLDFTKMIKKKSWRDRYHLTPEKPPYSYWALQWTSQCKNHPLAHSEGSQDSIKHNLSEANTDHCEATGLGK